MPTVNEAHFDAAVRHQVFLQRLAETVLLDWEKLVLVGERLPYSHENAYLVLADNRPPSLDDTCHSILLSEIATYCNLFDVDDVDMFVTLIRAMDAAFKAFIEKKRKRETKGGNRE